MSPTSTFRRCRSKWQLLCRLKRYRVEIYTKVIQEGAAEKPAAAGGG